MLRRNCSDVCTNLRVADTAVPLSIWHRQILIG